VVVRDVSLAMVARVWKGEKMDRVTELRRLEEALGEEYGVA
jgi:hypothetical protein